MTVPDGPNVNGFPPCPVQPTCWVPLCKSVDGLGCVYTFQSVSGTFTYGLAPADVASLYPAGDRRWWNYTPFVSPDPSTELAGCSSYPRWYNYVVWQGAGCKLLIGSAGAGDAPRTLPATDYPGLLAPFLSGGPAWSMLLGGNTFSPFFATSDGGGTCAAVLAP